MDVQRARRARDPRRLLLLAEDEGEVAGCAYCLPSDSEGRAHLAVRIRPERRRRGIGSALLRRAVEHAEHGGFRWASAHVDGHDLGSLAFAHRYGFQEVDRQDEQVLVLDGGAPPLPVLPPEGVRFVAVAERPDLFAEAYDLAVIGFEDMPFFTPVMIGVEDWLREEATLPGGSLLAVAGDELVGYSGLLDRGGGRAEDGLTVVRRGWRRRGLGTRLKRAKIAWAAAHGIREIFTWTQQRDVAMRAINERLGYRYRGVSIHVRTPLPLLVP